MVGTKIYINKYQYIFSHGLKFPVNLPTFLTERNIPQYTGKTKDIFESLTATYRKHLMGLNLFFETLEKNILHRKSITHYFIKQHAIV